MKKIILIMSVLLLAVVSAEPKKLTIRGSYYPEEKLRLNLNNKMIDVQSDYDVKPGYALGLEYSLFNNQKHTEVLGGASYMLDRHMYSKYWRTEVDIEGAPNNYTSGEDDLGQKNLLQTFSLYLNPRFLSGQPENNFWVWYAGLRLGYNFVNFKGDVEHNFVTDDGFFWGLSLGWIFNDTIDVSFVTYDALEGAAKFDEEKSVKGNYTFYSTSFSVGYRL